VVSKYRYEVTYEVNLPDAKTPEWDEIYDDWKDNAGGDAQEFLDSLEGKEKERDERISEELVVFVTIQWDAGGDYDRIVTVISDQVYKPDETEEVPHAPNYSADPHYWTDSVAPIVDERLKPANPVKIARCKFCGQLTTLSLEGWLYDHVQEEEEEYCPGSGARPEDQEPPVDQFDEAAREWQNRFNEA
jgi:hypothetical protein